jgi:spermidine synthase
VFQKKYKSPVLKLALFATGLSGIVAEYILSTLATYFLGDSVFQWTMILSVMLFAMGLGSRVSKKINGNLLITFIGIELALSFFVSYSSLIAYTASAYSVYAGFIIYSLSIIIGFFIGLEIPLVIRLNDKFESLQINIAAVLEMDYFGSLLGGLFFAFVGLPYFGLTYTPFILGALNLLVAITLWIISKQNQPVKIKRITSFASIATMLFLIAGIFVAKPIILHGEQHRYKDKIVFEQQSRYQKIVVTQWKNDYWLYINGNQQLSTLDEEKYHEVLVHPVLKLHQHPQNILVLGGGDGIAVKEILKHKSVKEITLVDLDPAMTELATTHPIFKMMNDNALSHPKVTVRNEDGYQYLAKTNSMFDAIIIDLPDPKSIELGRLYSYEFYRLCYKQLRPKGVIITQAGSPYFATKAFKCIDTTLTAAGFTTTPLHNQVVTLGEWGWILGSKHLEKKQQKKALQSLSFNYIETKWLNNEAMLLTTSFGKNIYFNDSTPVEVNKIHHPVLYQYYLKGNWDLY